MTDQPMTVVKYEYALPGDPVSPEQDALNRVTREVGNRVVGGIIRWMNAYPGERAEWEAKAKLREAKAERERAAERAAATPVPLTLDALLTRMSNESGWDRAYAEHIVQPYCRCGEDIDGWSYCQHARDLGLAP